MATFNLTPAGSVALSGGARILPAGPPHTYLGMARGFLNAVRPLAVAGPGCALPLAFLCAHVAECTLKAFLSRSGNDKRLRAKALRHNLSALWSLAHAEGLSIAATAPSWLQRLSALHDDPYYIRYSTGVHAMVTPGVEPMCTELEALVQAVERGL